MNSGGHGLLVLAVMIWGTLAGVIVLFARMTSTRGHARRAHREQRVYHLK